MKPSASRPNRDMQRRALGLMGAMAVVLLLILPLRLFQLQITRHEELESAALDQQLRETTIPASRGTISDRNGRVLAMSATTYSVYLSPAEISMYKENISTIAAELSPLVGVSAEKIAELGVDRTAWYKTVRRTLTESEAAAVREWKTESDIHGVKIEPDTKRYYPYSTLAAQTIGFVGTDNTGLTGLEYILNDALTGKNGSILRLKNSAGGDMIFSGYEDYVDAEDGCSVTLTIDTTLQYYLEKHLQQAVADYDIQNGACGIMMNPKTGEILAMASLDGFDLNNYQAVSDEVRAEMALCTDSDEAQSLLRSAQQRQWRNKAISDTYEPGSTFKIITLAMALEEGIVTPDSAFYCGGNMLVQGRGKPLKCWKTAGHGSQTLTQAAQHSCNVAFATIGLRVGEETFYQYCEDFGFFESAEDSKVSLSGRTGVSLPGESGSIWWSHDVFCDPENYSQLAAASFGQTFNITPLQLITAVSACCNGGKLMKPYIVDTITSAAGEIVAENTPTVIREVISRETSDQVNAILEQVVGDTREGTGKNAYVAGYRIAGKTGTSEKVAQDAAGGEKEYIVSFIGYAPADDPEIICLVLLDTPSNETGIYISGGQMAAPVVGRILADALPTIGIEPVYTEHELLYQDRAVPSLIGKTLEESEKLLKEAGFSCRTLGAGNVVCAQLPASGTVAAAGSAVILMTENILSDTEETVPELSGLTYGEARDILGELAFFVRSDSTIPADSDTVIVAAQQPAEGTRLKSGSVIRVTLVNDDDSVYGKY